MADEAWEEPFSPLAMMLPTVTIAGTVSREEIEAAGLVFNEPDHIFVILMFSGQVLGAPEIPGMTMEQKTLLTVDNAAMTAAILIGHSEKAIGRIAFSAKLDQQLSRVRNGLIKGNGDAG